MDLVEIGCEGPWCIRLAHYHVQWQNLLLAALNLWVLYVLVIFQVDGFDKDGFPLKRISPTAITGQNPGKVCQAALPICITTLWQDKMSTRFY